MDTNPKIDECQQWYHRIKNKRSSKGVTDIWENNKPISRSEEGQLKRFENNVAELKLGSGDYQFKVIRSK